MGKVLQFQSCAVGVGNTIFETNETSGSFKTLGR